MNTAPAGAFFLLEDIDALFRKRKVRTADEGRRRRGRASGMGITFSGLLNALDGVMAPSGRLVFMSTNHPEKLDPALIRPGRVDIRMEFPNADREQARQMFVRFFGRGSSVERLAEEFADCRGRRREVHGDDPGASFGERRRRGGGGPGCWWRGSNPRAGVGGRERAGPGLVSIYRSPVAPRTGRMRRGDKAWNTWVR